MKDIINIVKHLGKSVLLVKGVSKTIDNEAKERSGGFLSKLLSTLCARLLGNMFVGKRVIRTGEGVIRLGTGTVGARQEFQCCLIQSKLKSCYETKISQQLFIKCMQMIRCVDNLALHLLILW